MRSDFIMKDAFSFHILLNTFIGDYKRMHESMQQ